jgi:short-subunit dehydrogenase
MVGLSQALYEVAKEYGVKVSTVYPGITDTQMVRDLNPPTKPEQWMLPEDISYCVLFLLKQSPRMIVKDVVPWSVGYDRI